MNTKNKTNEIQYEKQITKETNDLDYLNESIDSIEEMTEAKIPSYLRAPQIKEINFVVRKPDRTFNLILVPNYKSQAEKIAITKNSNTVDLIRGSSSNSMETSEKIEDVDDPNEKAFSLLSLFKNNKMAP